MGTVFTLAPFLASAVLTALCAVAIARRRSQPGARTYAGLLLVETAYTLGYVMELVSTSLEDKLAWDGVQLVTYAIAVVGIPKFAWEYTERPPAHPSRVLLLLSIVPAVTCIFVLTDPWHGTARDTARIVDAYPFDSLLYDFTAFDWFVTAELLAVVGYAMLAFGRSIATQHPAHRPQTLIVALAVAVPTIAALLGLAGFRPFGQRDLTPASFGIGAVALTIALYRKRFFDLAPIARDLVFEKLPDPVVVLDARRRIVDANPAAQSTFGNGSTLVGRDAELLLPPDVGLEAFARADGRLSVTRGSHVFEVRADAVEPSTRDDRGHVLLFRDVTARELDARASETRFRTLFDESFQLMAVIDAEGVVLSANRTALDFAGLVASDVVGQRFVDLPWWERSPAQRERLDHGLAKAGAGSVVQLEVPLRDARGVVRHFDFSLKPLAPSSDGHLRMLAEGREITERLRAEEEQRRLRDQLHHAQKLESIGRLAGGIAHDLNNLLTVIVGQVGLARLNVSKGRDPTANLDPIALACDSAASLTRHLLVFARKQPSEPTVLDPNHVIEETSRMLGRVIGEEVHLQLELAPHGAHVRIDRGQLEQVLTNLVVNARDAMPNGGVLTIRTEKVEASRIGAETFGAPPSAHGYVRLSVSDTGVGMTPDVRARIFEPFFTTKPAGQGTGLGLATVYGVTTQAGGFVTVSSAPGVGSTFEVHLPVTLDPPPDVEPTREAPRGRGRIALVEDQPAVRALATEQLGLLGYDVVAYASAEQALDGLRADIGSVELLVTDVVLGGMTGPSLTNELRKLRRDLAVVYVSGYTDDAVAHRGVDALEDPLVHKPFTIDELARAVRDAIEHGRRAPAPSPRTLGPDSAR